MNHWLFVALPTSKFLVKRLLATRLAASSSEIGYEPYSH
jgi:hypothetical protein